MKTFILLCGPAGIGKSTWAANYQKSHENVKIVSSDAIRLELGNSYQDLSHEKEVWVRFSRYIREYFDNNKDVTVIADSTNFMNLHRMIYANETKDIDKHVLVIFRKPTEVILKQNRERPKEKFVPEEAILSQIRRWEEPNEEVLAAYDEVVEVK